MGKNSHSQEYIPWAPAFVFINIAYELWPISVIAFTCLQGFFMLILLNINIVHTSRIFPSQKVFLLRHPRNSTWMNSLVLSLWVKLEMRIEMLLASFRVLECRPVISPFQMEKFTTLGWMEWHLTYMVVNVILVFRNKCWW